jgi:nitric oxide reductase NorE protein
VTTAYALPAAPSIAPPQVLERDKSLPGDFAIWVFIWAELLVFAILFVSFAVVRARHVAMFDAMQASLDRNAGAVNTLLLISGSWCVARAVAAIKADLNGAALRWLGCGILAGGGFLVVKVFEYSAKFAAGINLTTNVAYMFYLSLTMFHFLHVILGMVILLAVWLKARRGGYSAAEHHGMETGASYWHMVDLVWLVLFPLVYVMR